MRARENHCGTVRSDANKSHLGGFVKGSHVVALIVLLGVLALGTTAWVASSREIPLASAITTVDYWLELTPSVLTAFDYSFDGFPQVIRAFDYSFDGRPPVMTAIPYSID